MKLHAETSISRVLLYLSVVLSLSGGGISENDLPNFSERSGSEMTSTQYDDGLKKNLYDTIDQHHVCRPGKQSNR